MKRKIVLDFKRGLSIVFTKHQAIIVSLRRAMLEIVNGNPAHSREDHACCLCEAQRATKTY